MTISPIYAAGFFDGEGCVNITASSHKRAVGLRTSLRVMIVNTNAGILTSFHNTFGGCLQKARSLNREKGWKLFRSLHINGQEAIDFLKIIQPYSIVKSEQIKLAIEYWDFFHRPKDERFYLKDSGKGNFKGKRCILTRRPEVVTRELQFKDSMHILNRKGLRAGTLI